MKNIEEPHYNLFISETENYNIINDDIREIIIKEYHEFNYLNYLRESKIKYCNLIKFVKYHLVY